jgi:glutaredoxin 3
MDTPHHVEVHYQAEKPELTLYYFSECPYCQRVLKTIRDLGLSVELRNIRETAAYREELIRGGGKSQVPCLFIDSKPLYESQDIMAYLRSIQ